MKKRNRSFEIFSLSLLDLFACCLGAFILITFGILPYIRKSDEAEKELVRISADLENSRRLLLKANGELAASGEVIAGLRRDRLQLSEENAKLRQVIENARELAFLGIRTRARNIILLFDMSGSVSSEGYEGIMLKTLKRMVEITDENFRLNLIGFQGDPPSPSLAEWQADNLAAMTPEQRASAVSWIDGLAGRWGGNTPTGLALEHAMAYEDVEAIFVFTDGRPTDSDRSVIVERVAELNKGKGIEIHAIAIGRYDEQVELQEFLLRLVAENNGQFMGVNY